MQMDMPGDAETVVVSVSSGPSFRFLALSADALLRLLAAARWEALDAGWLGLKALGKEGRAVFVVSQNMKLTRELATAKRNVSPCGVSVRCTMSVTRLGKSSFDMFCTAEVFSMPAQTLIGSATHCVTYVFVDYASRKSVPIPDHVRVRFEAAVAGTSAGRMAAARELQSVAAAAKSGADEGDAEWQTGHVVTTRPSDTDWNGHVNQSYYLQYAMDAIEAYSNVTEPALSAVSLTYASELHKNVSLPISVMAIKSPSDARAMKIKIGEHATAVVSIFNETDASRSNL
eukprot:Rhum_TRINITY_DN18972_c0_g1::Rhum_TRINITY_DN18972_c0_g1_i1::g.168914::m.168914